MLFKYVVLTVNNSNPNVEVTVEQKNGVNQRITGVNTCPLFYDSYIRFYLHEPCTVYILVDNDIEVYSYTKIGNYSEERLVSISSFFSLLVPFITDSTLRIYING